MPNETSRHDFFSKIINLLLSFLISFRKPILAEVINMH